MPVPQVGGSVTLHSTTATAVLNISAVPNGAWMVVSVMSSSSSNTVTAPATWTALAPPETTGTRRNFIFGKIRDSSDGSSVTFTQGSANTMAYGLIWGTDGGDVTSWIVGATHVRSLSGEPSGARYQNMAPSITTTGNNYLVLAISNEATLAQTQTNEVASVSPSGWTERLWFAQIAPNDRIETVWIGSKDMATPGSSGDVTLTYTSPQDNNGWALQVAIPNTVAPILTIPQVIGVPTQFISGSVTTGFSIARPSGLANGDYVVVAIRNQSGFTTEPTSPGFTRLGAATVLADSSSRGHGLYGKPITDALSEPSTYTFSYTTGSSRAIGVAFIVRGVDLTHPIAGFNNNYAGTSVTGGKQTPAYTLDTVPALSLFMGSSEFASPNDHIPLTSPSGFTSFAEVPSSTNTGVSRTYVWLGTKVQETSPTESVQITWGGPAGPAAEMISFQGLTSSPPPAEGYGFTTRNGTGGQVKAYYTTASGARTPSDLVPIRPGFSSVTQLLATPGATWAHRGGSVSYPEMSLHAYTQSVTRGYGVLEVSLARTSDGVWFGLHDQTTDRTSGGTYGNASAQTWAQIQAQQNIAGPGGAQPYMRWEQIIAAYGSSHVLVVDPKYALGSYRTEFLDMVDRDLGPTRAIVKYSGGGSGATALSTAAIARGYQTWGFFYAADASAALGGSGALQTWGPYWTTIGMDYTASQAVWDEALALGKPVIGHITPNQAAYNTAISKGASAVQVSGTGVVEPISWWNALPKRANLIAEYRFNEGSGNSVADMSGNRRTLTVDPSATWTTGRTGSGISTTGVSGGGAYHLTFANPTNAATLMGWAKPFNVSGEIPLFGFWSTPDANPNGSSHLTIYASRTAFGPSGVLNASLRVNGTLTAVTGSTMTLNTWQHVAVTFNGTTAVLYLNGQVVQTTPLNGTLGVGYFNAVGLSDAVVDDVRVFNTALTQDEITKWMNRSV